MTRAEINLSALTHNLSEIRTHAVGQEIIAVVKANAYGHGIEIVSEHLYRQGVRNFAVSSVSEAKQIRGIVKDADILILGASDASFMKEIIGNDFVQAIVSIEHARALHEQSLVLGAGAGKLRCHIKVDTGMTRFGVNSAAAEAEIDEIMSLSALSADGLFTHFACADSDEPSDMEFTINQQSKFVELAAKYKLKTHSQNSGGILKHCGLGCDMVRAGIALYGYSCEESVRLKPVMSLKSEIAQIRAVAAGVPVGYGRSYVTESPRTLAVVPVGYADGYSRLLSGRGHVLVKGELSPIRGRVCMDFTIIDITDIPNVKVGDEVAVYSDKNAQTGVGHIADLIGTIPYEVTCAVSARVPRIAVGR